MTPTRTVLYVAPDHSLSQMRKMVMEHAGYRVTIRESAARALATLQSRPFDLVVIGARTSATSARAVLEAVKENASRPLTITVENSRLGADYNLRPLAGAEELVAILGEALIRRHGHAAPPEGCYLFVDSKRRYIHVTDGAAALLGYQRGELIGHTIDEVSAPEMPVAERFKEYVEEGVQSGSYRLRHRDGSFVDVNYQAKVLPDGCMVSRLTRRKCIRPPARRKSA